MKDKEYSGKHVVVTGGGSGTGRALAHAFAAEGADLTITDINQECIVLEIVLPPGGRRWAIIR
jgi:NAD(P)-dependent dehydrogenase (short-subunit alcohol dehydrogenase family)